MDRFNLIVDGMTTVLWGFAWADHIDQAYEYGKKPCMSLSGVKIEDVMPKAPAIARQYSYQLIVELSEVNNTSITNLLGKAFIADFNKFNFGYGMDEEYITRFGECLAHMGLHHGISWFDDHEEFSLIIPNICNFDLVQYAIERCKECK
jgi:hypothetical protein